MRSEGDMTGNGLRRLLNEWDPIGVGDEVPDEYDCMLTPLLERLRRGAPEAEIADFLCRELGDHFGLDPVLSRPEAMAARVIAWWHTAKEAEGTRSRGG
ncbi:hypothetical protein ACIPSE_10080 [Streptomyces sp. NPDC090106]|uniref:hypothetical protein n=1 Tax=Streptomyces sp. NPDC090106 TaxID=3365946 RepID=UPI00381DB8EC